MILYLLIILISNIAIDLFGIFVFHIELSWLLVVSYTLLCTFTCFVIDLFIAIIVRKLPENLFDPNKKMFHIFSWERKFYEAIGIKLFKDKVPEIGRGFRKNKINEPKNVSYLYRYMLECCYGEIIHLTSIPIAFLAMFVVPLRYFLQISLPVIVINAFLCLLPFFVLRYNRKKIQKIYNRLKAKSI